ncbi:hypothetical protein ACFO25_05075 [Paenactinomyces guangxiensis]|uniref:Uncharacterized protein n=1 Tax=Paenactinomyces guangxiensis TaxID=1490290 RepID=A0A7W1WPN1_9BACL|nr:hypothetical protein [Paenactinomyces guangxiensis]MBA4493750.1 hypothetical protein [Paenactinomyces guangxiensis]MBH8591038.1 hypothetical protein [Paenactinomyces guangxiensis]
MDKSRSTLKLSIVILLVVFSIFFMFFSFVANIYKYEWAHDPQLAKIADPDALASAKIYAILSMIAILLAYILNRKSKVLLTVFIAFTALNLFRIIQLYLL